MKRNATFSTTTLTSSSPLSQTADTLTTSRPSTPASRIDQWLSERSKHSRPPPHMRVPSSSYVYESKGLTRNFHLPAAIPKTPDISQSSTAIKVNTNSEELWEAFVKKFNTQEALEEMVDEDKEDDEDDEDEKKMVDESSSTSLPKLIIHYKDIPWIGRSETSSSSSPFPQLMPLTCEDIGLSPPTFDKDLNRGELRDVFRTLFLRWHVDKFLPSYRNRLAIEDEGMIRERLNATTARLYQLRDELIDKCR